MQQGTATASGKGRIVIWFPGGFSRWTRVSGGWCWLNQDLFWLCSQWWKVRSFHVQRRQKMPPCLYYFFFPVPWRPGKSNTHLIVPKGCCCSVCASWPFSSSHQIWYAKWKHTLLTCFPLGERWPLNHNMIAHNVAEGENEMNFKLPFSLQICSCLSL